jgi:acyl-CoA thioester hydrolase
MISNETRIRVRYGETDRMGYLHHGAYALYFEAGRTELLRQLGLTYRQMEDDGILLPVREMKIEYFQPVLYDDEVIVKSTLIKEPSARLVFEYEINDLNNILICKAETTLVFVDASTRRAMRAPDFFMELVGKYFKNI